MINDNNKTEIIDQYLEGTLDETQRKEVEERMQADAEFRAEVALQQRIIHHVQELERAALKDEISALFDAEEHTTQEDPKMVAFSRRNVYYAVAATVLVVFTAGIFIWMNQGSDPLAGYVAVHLPEGSRGELPAEIPEQLPVLIIEDHPDYDFHYQFGDTLMLYGTFVLADLSVEYEPNQARYTLVMPQGIYPISPSDSIQALAP